MAVVDTPGSTVLSDSFEARAKRCLHIAAAMCDHPFNFVVIVVAASGRYDCTVLQVEIEVLSVARHIPLPNISVCVTPMDRVLQGMVGRRAASARPWQTLSV